ncbi:hypothetical protein PSPO01_04279 [Paraphaeosphaeria sporulosa]
MGTAELRTFSRPFKNYMGMVAMNFKAELVVARTWLSAVSLVDVDQPPTLRPSRITILTLRMIDKPSFFGRKRTTNQKTTKFGFTVKPVGPTAVLVAARTAANQDIRASMWKTFTSHTHIHSARVDLAS